ncbi:probable acyl-[acyl-carrier-protein]--UDP-N-acetylglucosamine O-acyltransferase, mitochondrial isoform X3 [Typha angustifolia]|uniref:probable acyl-[acyl-carrier-protein]--UDP-N-acetylglucosamine O-acyltransferase, mitochondrial isoform X3 n=1 Tax=Typha angustifolia TaxID=59011 RepID=UPI003C2C2434
MAASSRALLSPLISRCVSSLSIRHLITSRLLYGDALEEGRKGGSGCIHPSAVVHPDAVLGEGVSVGPFCTIGAAVRIGNACELHPGSHIMGDTKLGDQCVILTGAIVGADLPGQTVIGSNNVIGHYAVVGAKCQDLKYKVMSAFCTLVTTMTSESIAPFIDLLNQVKRRVGDNNIFANNTLLAGHVVVEDYTHTAGATVVHQFCHIGSYSFLGGGSVIAQDVPKYMMVSGDRAELRGLNLEGLRRNGFSSMEIRRMRRAYQQIFMRDDTNSGSFIDRLAETEQEKELAECSSVSSMVQSIRDSFEEGRRGICKFRNWNCS